MYSSRKMMLFRLIMQPHLPIHTVHHCVPHL